MNRVLLVSFEQNVKDDTAVMIIGEKPTNKPLKVVNVFAGKDAVAMYELLIKEGGLDK